eukprot:Skav210115  [mRNA]  locus=scaffold2194:79043:87475:+ [translate_table: standard]
MRNASAPAGLVITVLQQRLAKDPQNQQLWKQLDQEKKASQKVRSLGSRSWFSFDWNLCHMKLMVKALRSCPAEVKEQDNSSRSVDLVIPSVATPQEAEAARRAAAQAAAKAKADHLISAATEQITSAIASLVKSSPILLQAEAEAEAARREAEADAEEARKCWALRGETPLDVARRWGKTEVVQILEAAVSRLQRWETSSQLPGAPSRPQSADAKRRSTQLGVVGRRICKKRESSFRMTRVCRTSTVFASKVGEAQPPGHWDPMGRAVWVKPRPAVVRWMKQLS